MPQACITLTPYTSWNVSVTTRGQAEPPMITRRKYGSFAPTR
jgi:hypothetical protein